MTLVRRLLPFVVVGLLALLPYTTINIPVVFDGPVNTPGTLHLLASCLVFAGFALAYDLLFGRTGMLSFGHALYIATGVYGTAILVRHTTWPLWLIAVVVIVGSGVLALVLGSIALRTTGIAFAMVTLAFAQVASILIGQDAGGIMGGEEGVSLLSAHLPSWLVGVRNTVNIYWIALAFVVVVTVVVHRIDKAPFGRVLAAVRDDDRRVGVLGLNPFSYRLVAFVIASVLASLGGVVYVLLTRGASPSVAASNLTLSLLVMVVLGGPGTRWGPLIGGFLYALLDDRLTAVGSSSAIAGLPGVLRGPLSQPLFILGVLFILAVYFFPGGIASLRHRLGFVTRALRLSRPTPAPPTPAAAAPAPPPAP